MASIPHLPTTHLDALAHAIATDGLDRHEGEVTRLVRQARAAGITTPAVAALADPTHADALRQRAFAHVVAAVAAVAARPATARPATAA